jgi:shikimate kinase
MKMPGSFFLVGPMGAGKSTIGRQLARALNLTFLDTDREIEHRTGVDIPLIFEMEGEAGFREREIRILDELTATPGVVLATGGGAILNAENREHLSTRGKVIYLHTSVDQQLRRTGHDQHRPLLQTPDPKAKLEELMQIRAPLYQEIAHITINTDGCRIRDVVSKIKQEIEAIP